MKKLLKYFVGLVVMCNFTIASAQKRNHDNKGESYDPIVDCLDSIWADEFLKNDSLFVDLEKKNIFNFPSDSIPTYTDSVYEGRLKALDENSPFGLVYNASVKAYINVYAVRKRAYTSKVLGLTEIYFPLFEEYLEKYNLPMELKYLAIVESALNPRVKSRAGAVGLWQFMYGTGKMFGLRIDSYVDERRDPRKATEAACKYFRFLYKMYGEWELVLAAYNAGPGNVNKAIRRSGGHTDYWTVRKFLPRETRNYVPGFIAVNYVFNHSAEHNLYPLEPRIKHYEFDTVHVKQSVSFGQLRMILDIQVDELRYLNPSFKMDYIPVAKKRAVLSLPLDKVGKFIHLEDSIYNYITPGELKRQKRLEEEKRRLAKLAKENAGRVKKYYTIRSGDNLQSIANKFACRVSDIKRWNNMYSDRIIAGKRLIVYVKPSSRASTNSGGVKSGPVKYDSYIYYTVKKGDSFWSIALGHGNVSVDELKRLNPGYKDKGLQVGDKLKIGVKK